MIHDAEKIVIPKNVFFSENREKSFQIYGKAMEIRCRRGVSTYILGIWIYSLFR